MEDCLKSFCALFRRYMPNFADSIAASQLENKFEIFYCNLSSNTVDLSLFTNFNVIYSEIFNEFCCQCCSLIIDQRCSKTLLKKTTSTLHHLAWKSIPIRNYFKHSTTLSSSVTICLISLEEEENPKLLCLCLKIYQLLTYNDHDESYHNFNVDSLNTQDLAFHLAGLTCKHSQSMRALPDDVDILPPSLAILNNLCKIPKIRSYLASNVKFRDAIIKLLHHSKTSIVIGSLYLLMKLNDRNVCKLLSEKNLTDTLRCALNVLIKGDGYTARLHAADLFIEFLLKSEVTLNAIVNYCNLETSFEAIFTLFNTLDSREQLCKIVQFLTECFEVDSAVFSPIFCNVFQKEPSYFTTLFSLCQSSLDTVADIPDLPHGCLRLLAVVLENILSQNVSYFASSDCKVTVNDLKILIDESLKCPLETSCPFLTQKCSKIYYALQLAKVLILCSHRETRAAIINTVNPALCRHIFEFQAMSNPLLFMNSNSIIKRELPLWCHSGARIVLKIVDFLNCVRKFTSEISEYENVFKTLVDDQATQAVLTYGLTCRNVESVELALQVLASLSDDKLTKQTAKSLVHRRINETNSQQKSYESVNLSNIEGLTHTIDDGLNLRIEESQSQIGQIVESYEKKITASQVRERQLQEAKTFALQQGDRTLEQYRIAKQDAEKEALKLHASLHSSECKRDQIRQELEALKLNLKTQKQLESDLQQSCRDLRSELDASKDAISDYKLKIINMQKVEETYKREIESEKEMHDVLRKHYDTMKQNFKTTSEKILKVEDELEQSKKQFTNSSATIKDLKDEISDLIDKSNVKDEIARSLKEKVQELESEIARKQTTIKELERVSAKMKEEIDKHAQIADMIHKLTANK